MRITLTHSRIVEIPTLIPTMHVHGWYFGLFRLCLENMIAELHG